MQIGHILLKITRSNKFPNASWITNWVNASDYPSWDIDVNTAGKYEVAISYCAGANAVGTKFEIAFKGASIKGKISEAFDPPLYEHNDRIKRQESYDKPFKQLKLGTITLPNGAGELTVKSTSKPGEAVMELRSVYLRLIE